MAEGERRVPLAFHGYLPAKVRLTVAAGPGQVGVGATSQSLLQSVGDCCRPHRLAALAHLDHHPDFTGGIRFPPLPGYFLYFGVRHGLLQAPYQF